MVKVLAIRLSHTHASPMEQILEISREDQTTSYHNSFLSKFFLKKNILSHEATVLGKPVNLSNVELLGVLFAQYG